MRGYDGRIHLGTFRSNILVGGGGEYRSSFVEIPGGGLTDVAPAVAATPSGIVVIVRALDGAIYMNSRNGTTWTGWVPVPGDGRTPSGPAAAASLAVGIPHKLYIAVRGTDNRIYVNSRDEFTGAWSLWNEAAGDGRTASPPALTFYQGAMNMYVTGTDDQIHRNVNL